MEKNKYKTKDKTKQKWTKITIKGRTSLIVIYQSIGKLSLLLHTRLQYIARVNNSRHTLFERLASSPVTKQRKYKR